jgi:7-keto-8-aminopelargonate synthetase-like enzyme
MCTQVIIIVEGIYSMEGETTLLKELVELKKKYK